jgi:hypothetical protein
MVQIMRSIAISFVLLTTTSSSCVWVKAAFLARTEDKAEHMILHYADLTSESDLETVEPTFASPAKKLYVDLESSNPTSYKKVK